MFGLKWILKQYKKYYLIQYEKKYIEDIQHSPYYLKDIEWQTERMCLEAVKRDGMILRYVRNQTEKICLAALNQNLDSYIYIEVENFPYIYEKYKFMLLQRGM